MSSTFFGIKNYVQAAFNSGVTSLWIPDSPLKSCLLWGAIVLGVTLIVNFHLWKSPTQSKKPVKSSKKTRYIRRRCDDDEEVAPRRSNNERSNLDKKLRKLLQRLQRKSGTPILAAVIRDPFEKRDEKNDLQELEEMNASQSSLDFETERVWASGTGYGCSFDNASWDMNAWDSKQTKSYEEFTKLLDAIADVFSQIPLDENMRRVVRRSCLILFMHEHLSGSSMSIMNKHYSFFVSLLSVLNAIGSHRPELHSLCTMNIRLLNKTKINLWKTMNKLYQQAKQAATLSSFHLEEDMDEIARHVMPTFENMKSRLEESGKVFFDVLTDNGDDDLEEEDDEEEQTVEEEKVDDETSGCSGDDDVQKSACLENDNDDDSKDLEISYVDCMKELQFDMVTSFESHKFSADSQANGAPTRKLIRRLGSEFSDLAVSLPLTEESSIYLRVSESRMDMVKFLIIPADGTPYAGGCFVFDAYFPPIYPDGPPKVNLMTTGGGTVRFNPNLYEDGYVCLSLLGTWSGHSDGERWQPNISTFLQVVLSVQCLIFVPKPYYNEPGYESYSDMDDESERYSQDKRENTVRYAMIDALENPTPEFKKVIEKHFFLSKDRCMKNAKEWLGNEHNLVVKLQALLDKLDESVLS